jgi:hypothetical protein
MSFLIGGSGQQALQPMFRLNNVLLGKPSRMFSLDLDRSSEKR